VGAGGRDLDGHGLRGQPGGRARDDIGALFGASVAAGVLGAGSGIAHVCLIAGVLIAAGVTWDRRLAEPAQSE
jgi:hypothetical protein